MKNYIFYTAVLIGLLKYALAGEYKYYTPFENQLDEEKSNFKNTAPGFWDPKALVRVHYPQKKDAPKSSPVTTIMKAQSEEYAHEFDRAERNHFHPQIGTKPEEGKKADPEASKPQDDSKDDQCYIMNYPKDETADDLRKTYMNVEDSVVVTVWYENYQNQWGQNLINQDVRGTLWKIICKNHPHMLYTEADVSLYNKNAAGYKILAEELGLDINNLYDSPTILVLYKKVGMAFSADRGPRDLLMDVDKYLHQREKQLFGDTTPPCDIQSEVLADNYFEHNMPSSEVQTYEHKKDESGNIIKGLSEYSVSFSPAPRLVDSY